MMQVVLVALGAMVGAVMRWQLSVLMKDYFPYFPIATLVVNVLGSFIIGVMLLLNINDSYRLVIITGFLGSFTTFSAFSAEVVQAMSQKAFTHALVMVVMHLLLSIIAVILGMFLAKLLNNATLH